METMAAAHGDLAKNMKSKMADFRDPTSLKGPHRRRNLLHHQERQGRNGGGRAASQAGRHLEPGELYPLHGEGAIHSHSSRASLKHLGRSNHSLGTVDPLLCHTEVGRGGICSSADLSCEIVLSTVRWNFVGPPKVMKNAFGSSNHFIGTVALSFCHPACPGVPWDWSEADGEGSAVPRTLREKCFSTVRPNRRPIEGGETSRSVDHPFLNR